MQIIFGMFYGKTSPSLIMKKIQRFKSASSGIWTIKIIYYALQCVLLLIFTIYYNKSKKDIYLPNKLKPVKGEEEFTLFDLVGFTAIDEYEGELGEVIDVQEYPQQIIATVNFKGAEVLFPLNEEIIVGIDVVKEILNVDLPEGLLDIYLD